MTPITILVDIPVYVCILSWSLKCMARAWNLYHFNEQKIFGEKVWTMIQSYWSKIQFINRLLSPFRLVSSYGLFARMTVVRLEIDIQGSEDGIIWQSYQLPYKPGDPWRRPPFIPGHMPRLDWRLWFAALRFWRGDIPKGWFTAFLARLASGSLPVLRLCSSYPFVRPNHLRVVTWDYVFAPRQATDTASGISPEPKSDGKTPDSPKSEDGRDHLETQAEKTGKLWWRRRLLKIYRFHPATKSLVLESGSSPGNEDDEDDGEFGSTY